MKFISCIISFIFSGLVYGQDISAEYYWLGYSTHTEKEIGCSIDPSSILLYIYVEDKDSLKMEKLTEVTGEKFKRNKPEDNCSNCDQWFTSKKPNKNWTLGKYFEFKPVRFDSTDKIQWYSSSFKPNVILDISEMEKTSYLKGLFLRSGIVDSSLITLQLDNCPIRSEATNNCCLNLVLLMLIWKY